MKLQILIISGLFCFFAQKASSQMFETLQTTKPKPVEPVVSEEVIKDVVIVPEVTAEDILQQIEAEQAELPPATMTVEEKVAVKKTIIEKIANDVDKTKNNKERQELVNMISELQEISIRRQNLNLPEDEQIVYEKPDVNIGSREDVQKYLQEKLTAPIDRAMN